MESHSRSAAFGEEGGQDSDGPFERMRNFGSMGGGADMFSHPAWGGFSQASSGDTWPMDDPMEGMESLRQRPRPKFSSASGLLGPRPFHRERRSSGGPAEPPAADAAGPARERIIPIRVERDEADSGPSPQQHQPQQQQQQPSPRQQRPYVRRGTMDGPVSALQTEDLQRDARARSAPPEAEPQAAATAAAQTHRPNYFNSSPKPFSAQQRPLQTPAFGGGETPIPVQVERRQPQKHPQPQQPQQQQQQQQQPQQQQQETRPPPPKSPKERALETVAAVQQRVTELGAEVETFSGRRGERQHLYLDEMLTRELLKLDNVEANGDEEIRSARKQTIVSIQRCLAQLEAKLGAAETEGGAAEAAEAPMETAEGGQAAEGEAEGAEGAVKEGTEAAAPEEVGAGEGAAAAEEVEMKPVEQSVAATEQPAGESAQSPAAAPTPATAASGGEACTQPAPETTPAADPVIPAPETAPAADPSTPAPETAPATDPATPAPEAAPAAAPADQS